MRHKSDHSMKRQWPFLFLAGIFCYMLAVANPLMADNDSAQTNWTAMPNPTGDAELTIRNDELDDELYSITYWGPQDQAVDHYHLFQQSYDQNGKPAEFVAGDHQVSRVFYFKPGKYPVYELAVAAFDHSDQLLYVSQIQKFDSAIVSGLPSPQAAAENNRRRLSTRLGAISGQMASMLLDIHEASFPSVSMTSTIYGSSESLKKINLEQVSVEEAGVPQNISHVSVLKNIEGCKQPVDIVLLVDNSVSMQNASHQIQSGLMRFITDLKDSCLNWRVSLNSSTGLSGSLSGFESSLKPLEIQLMENLGFDETGSIALKDVTSQLSMAVWRKDARKVLMVFADEISENQPQTFHELSQLLINGQFEFYPFMSQPDANMQKLVQSSQGQMFSLYEDPADLIQPWTAPQIQTRVSYSVSSLQTGTAHEGRLILTFKNEAGHEEIQEPFQYTPPRPIHMKLISSPDLSNAGSAARERDFHVTVKVVRRDPDMEKPELTLHYRDSMQEIYQTLPMYEIGNDDYEAVIPSWSMEGYGIHFYVTAQTGGEQFTLPEQDAENQPLSVAVEPNVSPQARMIPVYKMTRRVDQPIRIEASDETAYIAAIRFYYRKIGSDAWTMIEDKSERPQTTFEAVIPGREITTDGVEYYAIAEDSKHTYTMMGSPSRPFQARYIEDSVKKTAFTDMKILSRQVANQQSFECSGITFRGDNIDKKLVYIWQNKYDHELSGNITFGSSSSIMSFSGKVTKTIEDWCYFNNPSVCVYKESCRVSAGGLLTALNYKFLKSDPLADIPLASGVFTFGSNSTVDVITMQPRFDYVFQGKISSESVNFIINKKDNSIEISGPASMSIKLIDQYMGLSTPKVVLSREGMTDLRWTGSRSRLDLLVNEHGPLLTLEKVSASLATAATSSAFSMTGGFYFPEQYDMKAKSQTFKTTYDMNSREVTAFSIKHDKVTDFPKNGMYLHATKGLSINYANRQIDISTSGFVYDDGLRGSFVEGNYRVNGLKGVPLYLDPSAGTLYYPPLNGALMVLKGNGKFFNHSWKNGEIRLLKDSVEFKFNPNFYGLMYGGYLKGNMHPVEQKSTVTSGTYAGGKLWESGIKGTLSGKMTIKGRYFIKILKSTLNNVPASGVINYYESRYINKYGYMATPWKWNTSTYFIADTKWATFRVQAAALLMPQRNLGWRYVCGQLDEFINSVQSLQPGAKNNCKNKDKWTIVKRMGHHDDSRSITQEQAKLLKLQRRLQVDEVLSVVRDAPSAMIIVDGDEAAPEFDVIMPDGTVVAMKDHLLKTIPELRVYDPAERRQEPDLFFVTKAEEKQTIFMFPTPAKGDYIVRINNFENTGAYSLELVMANTEPVFKFKNVQVSDTKTDMYSMNIGYDLDDVDQDDGVNVQFFLTRDLDGGTDTIPLSSYYTGEVSDISFSNQPVDESLEATETSAAADDSAEISPFDLNRKGANQQATAVVNRNWVKSGQYDIIAEVSDGITTDRYSWKKFKSDALGKIPLSETTARKINRNARMEIEPESSVTAQQTANLFELQAVNPPAKILNVSARVQDASTLVQWRAPSETNIHSFTVKVQNLTQTSDPILEYQVTNPQATSYEVLGLNNGQVYGITVQAFNAERVGSLPSDYVRVTPVGTGESGTPDLIVDLENSELVVAGDMKSATIHLTVTNVGNRKTTGAGLRVFFSGTGVDYTVTDSAAAITQLAPGESQAIDVVVTPSIIANFLLKNNPLDLPNQTVQFRIYNTAPLEINSQNNIGILSKVRFENQASTTVNLNAGWNLIAPPFATSIAITANPLFPDNNFEALFGPEAEVWVYRNKEWYNYNSQLRAYDLENIMPGESFWVYLPEAREVTYIGVPYPFDPNSLPARIVFKLLATDFEKLREKGLSEEQLAKLEAFVDKGYSSLEEFMAGLNAVLDEDEMATMGPVVGDVAQKDNSWTMVGVGERIENPSAVYGGAVWVARNGQWVKNPDYVEPGEGMWLHR
ncbi:MAG: fibronectin type III domain-containing protein [SAR324 cluster bacterium]|nr:fibronectin type III domain-containing protein [SAR324 cluster bacterium]